MNEINKPEINIAKPVSKNIQPDSRDAKVEKNTKSEDFVKDYKEAADNRGADAAGRAMVMINNVKKADAADNIDNDIAKILKNPKLVDQSDALFNAAEKAGVPYPVAASFATSELG